MKGALLPSQPAGAQALLLFTLGGRRWAAAPGTVRRVARRGADGTRFWNDTRLGSAPEAKRGLVAKVGAGEEALAVDEILGMVEVPRVHPLPALLRACMPGEAFAGLIEYESELLPLVDLPVLLERRMEWEERHGAERSAGEDGDRAHPAEGGGR